MLGALLNPAPPPRSILKPILFLTGIFFAEEVWTLVLESRLWFFWDSEKARVSRLSGEPQADAGA